MTDEQVKQHHRIISDTWQMLKHDLQNIEPTTEYLDAAVSKYQQYEQQWKQTPLWTFAGRECSAKLQEIERIWKEERKKNGHTQ